MKKFISTIISTIMLMSLLPIIAQADSGTYGDFEYVVFDDNSGIQISGYIDDKNTDIEIPTEINGLPVVELRGYIFDGCVNLKTIKLPKTISNLGHNAGQATPFSYDIPNLESIDVDPNNPYFTSVDGVLFNKDMTTLIKYPQGKRQSEYTIPNSVTQISEFDTFYNITYLEKLTISDNLEKTPYADRIYLDNSNANLSNISVGQSNPYFTSVDGVLFNKDISEIILYPCGKRQTEYQIPNTVTSVFRNAFRDCIYLNKVVMPSVTVIGDYAFDGCASLIDIFIPVCAEKIVYNAFRNLNVYYGGTKEQWNNITMAYTLTSEYDYYPYSPYHEYVKDYKKRMFNSNFYYNATGTEPPKVGEVNIISNSDSKTAEILLDTVEYDSTLITIFNSKNTYIDSNISAISAGDTSKEVKTPDNADSVKVFIWDSLEGMRPLCEAKTKTIE